MPKGIKETRGVFKLDKLSGEVLERYDTLREAGLATKVEASSILRACKGKYAKTCRGFKWKLDS